MLRNEIIDLKKLLFLSFVIILSVFATHSYADNVEFKNIKKVADKNNDELISCNEFTEAFLNQFWGDKTEAKFKCLVYDINLDNTFDEREFLLSKDDFYIRAREAFIHFHLILDRKPHGNEDNVLEYKEMSNWIKSLEPDISADELQKRGYSFTKLDSNGDKKLEWSEYLNYYKRINNK